MRIEKVREIKEPLSRMVYWIREREQIRLRKSSGEPFPWTDDVILSAHRFCNVRRMDDRVSCWLYENWYLPYRDHENIVVAAVIARQLNNISTLQEVGFPGQWKPNRVSQILRNRVKNGLKNFSAAYMITGTLGGTKIEQIVYKVVDPIHRNPPRIDSSSMEISVQSLIPYAGFSTFMAGQVVADLRWAMSGRWKDKNHWAAIGPGSRRGFNRLLGRELSDKQIDREFSVKLLELIGQLKKFIPESISSRLEAIDWQNILCEFDKYERVLWGQGRPKQRYRGENS